MAIENNPFQTQHKFADTVAKVASLREHVAEHDENIETLVATLGNTPGGTAWEPPLEIPDPTAPTDTAVLSQSLTQLEQTMTSNQSHLFMTPFFSRKILVLKLLPGSDSKWNKLGNVSAIQEIEHNAGILKEGSQFASITFQ